MAFSIYNLPEGWSSGRVGKNRVFHTPEGKQISQKDAMLFFKTGSNSDDSRIIKRPVGFAGTGANFDPFAGIVEDRLGSIESTAGSFQNGGSDGSGNPDPVDDNPLGDVGGLKTMNSYLSDGDTDNIDLTTGGLTADQKIEEAGFSGTVGDKTVVDIGDGVAGDGVAGDDGAGDDGDDDDGDDDLNKKIIQRSKDRVKEFQEALMLLGQGDINKVIADYEARISGGKVRVPARDADGNIIPGVFNEVDAEIGSSGRPDTPTAKLSDGSIVDVSWGTDPYLESNGWGHIVDVEVPVFEKDASDNYIPVIDPETGEQEIEIQQQFQITAETAKAGEEYTRDNAQIDQMEEFIERMAAAQSDDARQLIIQEEMALLNRDIADDARINDQRNAEANIGLQGDIQKDLQESAQAETRARDKIAQDLAKIEADRGRDFTREERLAIEEYNDAVRGERRADALSDIQRSEEFTATENALGRALTTSEREAVQAFQKSQNIEGREFQTQERIAGETTARDVALQGQEFQSGERLAGEQTARNVAQQRQGYQSGERVAGEETARDVATTADERAAADREDRQANEQFQREQAQQFNTTRDTIEFDRQSRLESVRLGITNATSEEGIARAVELADEARGLERAQTMLDVVQQISQSGLGRQLQDSGILEQLASEFGVDLSFLIRGGLGSGISNAPVRITA
jgi:hypothetical protein